MVYQKNSSNCNNEYCMTYGSVIRREVNNEKNEELINGLRKGPWSAEEDSKLISAISIHGEGHWNILALLAGLKRSGKSCRLRWLNYLRPDLRRGSFTLDEQLLILELQLRCGNRWSKIAEHLPGRTDNEVKNYCRTKVQKLAKQFQCNVNSPEFRDALRHIWIPRLVQQIQAAAASPTTNSTTKAQNEGPVSQYDYGLTKAQIESPYGVYSSCSSTSSDYCCLFDAPISWSQNSLDQPKNGPTDLCYSTPYVSSEAHISEAHTSSAELGSCSSAELDLNWEQINDFLSQMTPNNLDDLLFLEHQQHHLA